MLRSALSVVLILVVFSTILSADDRPSPHVRGLDAWAVESLERGLRGSALMRELVSRLDGSDVIVHVESVDVVPRGLGGMTRFAAALGGVRYVRVTLNRQLSPDARSATLAHELQHANELASAGVKTRADVQRLDQGTGFRLSTKELFYETDAAAEAGIRAWEELRGYRSNVINGQGWSCDVVGFLNRPLSPPLSKYAIPFSIQSGFGASLR